MSDDAVVIVNGARTAMGGFQGSLSAVSAPELGAASVREGWVKKSSIRRKRGGPPVRAERGAPASYQCASQAVRGPLFAGRRSV